MITSIFNREALFTYDGWSIDGYTDDRGVHAVFCVQQVVCGISLVLDPKGGFGCPKCALSMSPATKEVLKDALCLLAATIVVEINPLFRAAPRLT